MSEIIFPIMEGPLLSLNRLSSFQVNCSFFRHYQQKYYLHIGSLIAAGTWNVSVVHTVNFSLTYLLTYSMVQSPS